MSPNSKFIGRYAVQRVLGRGAMGVVYLAKDPLLKRLVAIKVVHCAAEDRAVNLLRFQREAEINARLNHPSIVTVFDVGEDPDSGPFLAMEYVDGVPLSRLIKQGIEPERGLKYLIQGIGALTTAEAAGITHRDIKPDNILISHDGRFKLMDFGIARGDEDHLTLAGMIFGTPSYTAPELLVGKESSPVTDRYAYSVAAFELLFKQLPFHGATVGATLHSVVHDPPRFPETCTPELQEVFTKALAKLPADRYPDLPSFMHALVDAVELWPETRQHLHAYIDGDSHLISASGPMATMPSTTDELAPPSHPIPTLAITWWRRPWFLATAAVLVAIAGVESILLRASSPWSVEIVSLPGEADVMVDGRYIGRTPLNAIQLKGQRHLLRLEKDGYLPAIREITRGEWSLQFALIRKPYMISVITDPPGAEVFINGAIVGTTPLPNLPIPMSGPQEMRIHKRGYQDWTAQLDRDLPFPTSVRLNPITRAQ